MAVYTAKRCKVCQSPRSGEYTQLWLDKAKNGYTLYKLEALAKSYGENISFQSFYRHMTRHLEPSLRQSVAMSLDTKEIVKERLAKEVQTVDEISKNLALCRDLIAKMLKLEPTAQNTLAIRALMTEIRLTLDSTAKLRKQMALDEVIDKDKILTWVVGQMESLPEEKLEKSLLEPKPDGTGVS